MQVGNHTNQTQPQPVTWNMLGQGGAIEALENRAALLFGDPRARVGNLDDDHSNVLRDGKTHFAAYGREFDRVIDQVGNQIAQQIPIAPHGLDVTSGDKEA